MRVLILGNSGSGKSTLARSLAAAHGLAHLDLDTIVWVPGEIAVPRPVADVHADLQRFAGDHAVWVIEGCYGDLVEVALPWCSELVFLNPGEAACLANNARRPWEPHKYADPADQARMLPFLREWVSQYYAREDSCSYRCHRRVFDSFAGSKREITTAS